MQHWQPNWLTGCSGFTSLISTITDTHLLLGHVGDDREFYLSALLLNDTIVITVIPTHTLLTQPLDLEFNTLNCSATTCHHVSQCYSGVTHPLNTRSTKSPEIITNQSKESNQNNKVQYPYATITPISYISCHTHDSNLTILSVFKE